MSSPALPHQAIKVQPLIRSATPADTPAIHALIHELAIFELEPQAHVTTVEDLIRDGFGPQPSYLCWVAEWPGQGVVGMSFCYIRYSTWKGRRLYLEDLIVTELMRGQGIGQALFTYTVAQAKTLSCSALCWQVLDWNQPALDFYIANGAKTRPGWVDMYVEVDAG